MSINKNILIFLLTAIGLIVLPHIENLPPSVTGYFYLLLCLRFAGVWRPQWLPSKLMLLLLTVIGIAILYGLHEGIFGRDAGTRLFVTALGLKLLEIKSERDLYLIIFLAFIVATSLFLYQQSIFMAAYILLVCCVLLGTLVCINSNHSQTWQSLKTAGVIVAQAIPMTIVIFILFPRVEAPKWMYFNDKHQARTGLSDNIEPGAISNLAMSDELVFRVQFTGTIPPSAQRYWRGPVLTHTDGKRWTQNANGLRQPIDQPKFTGNAYQYTLLMEPQDKNWVFALDLPADVAAPLRRNSHYQLVTSANPDKRTEYRITSYPTYNTGTITKDEYQEATQLPGPASARVTQLVQHLHGFDGSPDIFIKQLLNHFKTEDFYYTLTPPLMQENPIEQFLFESHRGFCEHYATAFVYLMRVAHIPARVVTGYQGGELNQVGNFLDIKQAYAHAWAEVWLENRGWVRVDPTAAIAPERIEQNINIDQQIASGIISFTPNSASAAVDWLKNARQLWGNVDYQWQRWVINYDNKNQSQFLSSLGISDLKSMIYWMAGIIGVITAVLCWLLLRNPSKTVDPAVLAYQRFCKKLAKNGLIKKPGEGAKDFAFRAKRQLPEQATGIEHITQLFIKLHYGKQHGKNDLQQLNRMVAAFKGKR
jgi:transglutaminase-like putative cysteine protease